VGLRTLSRVTLRGRGRLGVWASVLAVLLFIGSQSFAAGDGAGPLDPAKLLNGRWRVSAVRVSSSGVQARSENDPEFMKLTLIVTDNQIRLGSQRCDKPRYSVRRSIGEELFSRTFGASPRDFGLSFAAGADIDIIAIACASGNVGPEAAGNSSLIQLPSGEFAMSYFDGVLLFIRKLR